MRNFKRVLEKSRGMGEFDKIDDLKAVISDFASSAPQSFNNAEDGGGKRWIEFYDNHGALIILLHTHYRLAFVLSKFKITNNVYCVKVDSFNNAEWFISDMIEFNEEFPYIFWDETSEVVNHRKFSLLDMRFVTE